MVRTASDTAIIAATRRWVDRAVIGLNLCPFAKAVQTKGQVHYVVSGARRADQLMLDLVRELRELATADPKVRDNTLLIHPRVLTRFTAFLAFLDIADEAVRMLDLEGVLQIASFHPRYRFEGTAPNDIDNHTNRSPYPTLHLLREASIDRAVAAFPEAEAIFAKNIETLRTLGLSGWRKLDIGRAGQATPVRRAVPRASRIPRRSPRRG